MERHNFQRILIVGTGGSGKSHLSCQLASTLKVRHVELDNLYWEANWSHVSDTVFLERVSSVANEDSWIIDGNYSKCQPIIFKRATIIIWLDYSFLRVFTRILLRTIKRIITQEELFSGNRETFQRAFLRSDSILLWVIKTFSRHRKRYGALYETNSENKPIWLRFESPSHTNDFITEIKSMLVNDVTALLSKFT